MVLVLGPPFLLSLPPPILLSQVSMPVIILWENVCASSRVPVGERELLPAACVYELFYFFSTSGSFGNKEMAG